jgi:hypothetical protein
MYKCNSEIVSQEFTLQAYNKGFSFIIWKVFSSETFSFFDKTSFNIILCIFKEYEFDKAITSNGYPAQPQKYNDFIQSCKDGKIKTKSEAAMYLATLLHEYSGLRVTEENYNPASIAAYGRYIGRGYIQLSSEANYRAASDYFGEDYVRYPDQVKNDPHAWNVSAWYWQDQVHRHVNGGFRATVMYGIRPLEPYFDSREKIYGNVCRAFNVSQQL